MTEACTVKFGLNTAASQAEIVAALSREKIESIQTASGLCVKASPTSTRNALGDLAGDLTISELTSEERALPDIAAFI